LKRTTENGNIVFASQYVLNAYFHCFLKSDMSIKNSELKT